MLSVTEKPKRTKPSKSSPSAPKADSPGGKRKRNAIFLTLDDAIESRLQKFLDSQRVKPDRAAVALTALIEFLDRVDAESAE